MLKQLQLVVVLVFIATIALVNWNTPAAQAYGGLIQNGDFEDGYVSWDEQVYNNDIGYYDTDIIQRTEPDNFDGFGNFSAIMYSDADYTKYLSSSNFVLPDTDTLNLKYTSRLYVGNPTCVLGTNGVAAALWDLTTDEAVGNMIIRNSNGNIPYESSFSTRTASFSGLSGRQGHVMFLTIFTVNHDPDCSQLFYLDNISLTAPPNGKAGIGYRFVADDGGVFAYGSAPFYGSTGNINLNRPIVGNASKTGGKGYWLVASDGGIFSYGDAKFFGSTGAINLNRPIVGMASTPSGNGYWLVASDGGIFSYGDAKFFGSTGAITLNSPIVTMISTKSGNGYWLVAKDGGIFAYGDAVFYGSTGGIKLSKPIVGAEKTANGSGYWLVASDGGIFAFGSAPFYGSTGNINLNSPIVGMARASTGGYWLVAADGGIFTFNAPFYGSTGGIKLNRPIVGIATQGY